MAVAPSRVLNLTVTCLLSLTGAGEKAPRSAESQHGVGEGRFTDAIERRSHGVASGAIAGGVPSGF